MNRLKGFRLMKGMTQKRLAQAIGTTQAHVSEYENGTRRLRNMPALQFVRLMTTLDVTPSLLLEDDVERPYDDVRERMRDAEHEVAALRREYAERGRGRAGAARRRGDAAGLRDPRMGGRGGTRHVRTRPAEMTS